jgi:hypothetical protein
MIARLAGLLGVPGWAVKIGLVIIAALALLWAYAAWRDGVIAEHEAEVQANVEVVTGEAEKGADAALDKAVADFAREQEQDRKEVADAKAENRSPLDALFD